MGALVAAAGFRSSTGALLEPLEEEFGWSRATTSGAVTLNLVVYGLTAPFAAALMERFGVRRVVAGALALVAIGSGLTLVMTSAWQLWLLWGFAVGIGTGSLALVFGAIVANRWFVTHRGVIVGVFSAASSTGQLVFLPAIARLADGPGWRWAAGLVTVFALLLVPLVWLVLRDKPADVGTTAYGAPDDGQDQPAPAAATSESAARLAIRTLKESSRSRTFWFLVVSFWICGWSTNGLIGTHFIPAAHDHGMPPTTSAGLLALIGIFDIIGTVASGWLTDRVDSRYLLFTYYFLRGLSLLVVPGLLAATVHPSLFVFIVFYGLDWVATVPPTVALCRQHFGSGEGGHRLRLGVRQPHGRRRHRRVLRRLGAAGGRRLLRGLDDGRRAVPGRSRPVPADPAAPGGARGHCDDGADVTSQPLPCCEVFPSVGDTNGSGSSR